MHTHASLYILYIYMYIHACLHMHTHIRCTALLFAVKKHTTPQIRNIVAMHELFTNEQFRLQLGLCTVCRAWAVKLCILVQSIYIYII